MPAANRIGAVGRGTSTDGRGWEDVCKLGVVGDLAGIASGDRDGARYAHCSMHSRMSSRRCACPHLPSRHRMPRLGRVSLRLQVLRQRLVQMPRQPPAAWPSQAGEPSALLQQQVVQRRQGRLPWQTPAARPSQVSRTCQSQGGRGCVGCAYCGAGRLSRRPSRGRVYVESWGGPCLMPFPCLPTRRCVCTPPPFPDRMPCLGLVSLHCKVLRQPQDERRPWPAARPPPVPRPSATSALVQLLVLQHRRRARLK